MEHGARSMEQKETIRSTEVFLFCFMLCALCYVLYVMCYMHTLFIYHHSSGNNFLPCLLYK